MERSGMWGTYSNCGSTARNPPFCITRSFYLRWLFHFPKIFFRHVLIFDRKSRIRRYLKFFPSTSIEPTSTAVPKIIKSKNPPKRKQNVGPFEKGGNFSVKAGNA